MKISVSGCFRCIARFVQSGCRWYKYGGTASLVIFSVTLITMRMLNGRPIRSNFMKLRLRIGQNYLASRWYII